jgi:protease-4
MSDVAGSGGYYIAMAASRILAQPETITGSIGVVSAMVNVRGTLDLLGIRSERVSRGKRAALFSPFSPPDPAALEPLRKFMETFYWQFVDKAAEGRGKTRDELHAVARGRVWTGRQAVERGLVDELGGLDRAIAVARELARVEEGEKLELTEAPAAPNFFEALSETFGVSLGLPGLLPQPASPVALGFLAVPEVRKAVERACAIAAAAREGPVAVLPLEVEVR